MTMIEHRGRRHDGALAGDRACAPEKTISLNYSIIV